MNTINYNPDIAIHPGVTLKDTLDSLGMSQKELAERTGLAIQTVNKIIRGIDPITPETAVKLERVFGTSAAFWNNLDRSFQESTARIKAEKKLQEEYSLARKFTCYSELVQWQYVPEARDIKEKTNNLLRFFGVNSLRTVDQLNCIAFRKSEKKSISRECVSAWLRCGELDVQKKDSKSKSKEYDQKKLIEFIDEFRKLTLLEPEEYGRKIKTISEDCGVNIVFTPYIKKTYINGATRWINNNPLIQISPRFSFSDIFWFTFFHELGHIILHGKKDKFIEFDFDMSHEAKEKEANDFASSKLIPEDKAKEFFVKNDIDAKSLVDFAKNVGIHPGIVAGRLAHEGKISWNGAGIFRQRIGLKNQEA
jgi:HTH-type transcriptional regulator/antitoxin HigA